MKNIYNKVIIDATMLMTTLAVCPRKLNTLGMAVFMASVKSLLLKNLSIAVWFSVTQSRITPWMLLWVWLCTQWVRMSESVEICSIMGGTMRYITAPSTAKTTTKVMMMAKALTLTWSLSSTNFTIG